MTESGKTKGNGKLGTIVSDLLRGDFLSLRYRKDAKIKRSSKIEREKIASEVANIFFGNNDFLNYLEKRRSQIANTDIFKEKLLLEQSQLNLFCNDELNTRKSVNDKKTLEEVSEIAAKHVENVLGLDTKLYSPKTIDFIDFDSAINPSGKLVLAYFSFIAPYKTVSDFIIPYIEGNFSPDKYPILSLSTITLAVLCSSHIIYGALKINQNSEGMFLRATKKILLKKGMNYSYSIRTLCHEYVHKAMLLNGTANFYPNFLGEGVAEFVGNLAYKEYTQSVSKDVNKECLNNLFETEIHTMALGIADYEKLLEVAFENLEKTADSLISNARYGYGIGTLLLDYLANKQKSMDTIAFARAAVKGELEFKIRN